MSVLDSITKCLFCSEPHEGGMGLLDPINKELVSKSELYNYHPSELIIFGLCKSCSNDGRRITGPMLIKGATNNQVLIPNAFMKERLN